MTTNRTGLAQLQAGFDALGIRHVPSAGNFAQNERMLGALKQALY